jgi:aquaporin Z
VVLRAFANVSAASRLQFGEETTGRGAPSIDTDAAARPEPPEVAPRKRASGPDQGLRAPFAFGLTVLTMAYAIGHISGCHLNPAVTVGLTAGRRFPPNQIAPYIVAQLAGAILAAAILYLIARGAPNFDVAKGFAANGFGEHSAQYSLLSALVTEVVLTMMFLFIIMGSMHGKAPAGFAPIAIGLA